MLLLDAFNKDRASLPQPLQNPPSLAPLPVLPPPDARTQEMINEKLKKAEDLGMPIVRQMCHVTNWSIGFVKLLTLFYLLIVMIIMHPSKLHEIMHHCKFHEIMHRSFLMSVIWALLFHGMFPKVNMAFMVWCTVLWPLYEKLASRLGHAQAWVDPGPVSDQNSGLL